MEKRFLSNMLEKNTQSGVRLQGLRIAVLANSLKQYDNSNPEEADIIFADDHTYRNALKYGKPVAVVIDPWNDEIYEEILNNSDITMFLKADYDEETIWGVIKVAFEDKEDKKEHIRFENGKLIIDINASKEEIEEVAKEESPQITERPPVRIEERKVEELQKDVEFEEVEPVIEDSGEVEDTTENSEEVEPDVAEILPVDSVETPLISNVTEQPPTEEVIEVPQEKIVPPKIFDTVLINNLLNREYSGLETIEDVLKSFDKEYRKVLKSSITKVFRVEIPDSTFVLSQQATNVITVEEFIADRIEKEKKLLEEAYIKAQEEFEKRKKVLELRVYAITLAKMPEYDVIPLYPTNATLLFGIPEHASSARTIENLKEDVYNDRVALAERLRQEGQKNHEVVLDKIPILTPSVNAYKTIGVIGDDMLAIAIAFVLHGLYPNKVVCVSTAFAPEGDIDVNLYAGNGDGADYIIDKTGGVNIMAKRSESDLVIEYNGKQLIVPNYFFLKNAFQAVVKHEKLLKEIVTDTLKSLENLYNIDKDISQN
jgi:hypothetical protein